MLAIQELDMIQPVPSVKLEFCSGESFCFDVDALSLYLWFHNTILLANFRDQVLKEKNKRKPSKYSLEQDKVTLGHHSGEEKRAW